MASQNNRVNSGSFWNFWISTYHWFLDDPFGIGRFVGGLQVRSVFLRPGTFMHTPFQTQKYFESRSLILVPR